MTTGLQSWLQRMPEFHGLLAAYVVTPPDPPETRVWSGDFSGAAVVSLHRQIQDVLDVLDAGQMPSRKLRWIFDRTVVYFERRKDGAGMCLITTHDPWAGEGDVITQLIAEFRSAP